MDESMCILAFKEIQLRYNWTSNHHENSRFGRALQVTCFFLDLWRWSLESYSNVIWIKFGKRFLVFSTKWPRACFENSVGWWNDVKCVSFLKHNFQMFLEFFWMRSLVATLRPTRKLLGPKVTCFRHGHGISGRNISDSREKKAPRLRMTWSWKLRS